MLTCILENMTKPNGIENISSQEVGNVISLEDFRNSGESEELHYEIFNVPVERIVLADNIRPFDNDFIDTLAMSIHKHGQLQACIGDIVCDGEGTFVRLIAGQHRFKSIVKLNLEGEDIPVKISLANRELNPYEIIEIQITENLHNKMTPAQEAQVINGLWQKVRILKDNGGEKLSIAEFARSVSRSPATVRDAIKYIEGLSPVVQRLVDEKILPYTVSLLLTEAENIIKGRDREKQYTLEDVYREQLYLAQKFVTMNFTYDRAKKYIEQLKQESNFSGPLFGDEWKKIEFASHIIAIRDESDKKGRDAAGWFVKIIRMVQLLPDTNKVEFSDAIENAIFELGMSRDEFEEKLRPLITEKQHIRLFGKGTKEELLV